MRGFNHLLQELAVHGLDRVLRLLQDQPLQHVLLGGKVTLVDGRLSLLKVDESREALEAELVSDRRVRRLDKDDPVLVGLRVNVLQLLQRCLALGTVFLVCSSREDRE